MKGALVGSHKHSGSRVDLQAGGGRLVSVLLVGGAMVLVVWIRLLPWSLGGVDPAARAQLTYTAADGHEHVYLGDFDSYYWLRAARRYLESGSICDRIVNGECRDEHARAPFGGLGKYERSLHVASIVWLHRLMTWLIPGYPLPSSAFLVPVIVGALGILPAFAIGRRLAGSVGGLFAAVIIAVNPLLLARTFGSDNDVWNVVLPLLLMWAAIRTADARSVLRQVAYGTLGVIVVVLHAVTWNGWIFTYAVVQVGLFIHLCVTLLSGAVHGGRRAWTAPATRQAAVAAACFCAVPFAVAHAPGADAANVLEVLQPVREIFRTALSVREAADWPEGFASVGELARPDLKSIARMLAGVAYFFVAWLGLVLLLLPGRGWDWRHFATLIGGNYLYAYLVTRPNPGRLFLLGLLTLPLAVAMLFSVVDANSRDEAKGAAALLVVGWFLCALFLAFDGLRFIMLMIPPFGIAFGVAIGRLYEWLTRLGASRPERSWTAPALFAVLATAILYLPVRSAYGLAIAYVPRVNDAWWDTLTRIADKAPPETIVTTWWPYGYFAEYAADRRTTADGGTLSSHVPSWLARALLAPTETEALGLLRMLDCGSDLHPLRREEVGAFDLIVRQGIDGSTAQAMLSDVTRRRREAAEAYLRAHAISAPARQQILERTHCQPPPGLLILSSEMIDTPGWKYLGSWSLQNAYVANRLRGRSEAEAVRELTEHFGLSEEDGRALYRRAAHLDTAAARIQFVSPHQSYFTKAWMPCQAESASELICTLNLQVPPHGDVLERFVYQRDAPSAGRLQWRRGAGQPHSAAADAVIVAGAEGMTNFPAEAVDGRLAILVDVANDRVLVGTPALLRSTFTQLMFLDGRYARHFRKVDERTGYRGERVTTWMIDWGPDS